MCKAIEDMRNEALEWGRMEGRILSKIEDVRKMMEKFGLSAQQVKDLLDISDDDWKLIAAQI